MQTAVPTAPVQASDVVGSVAVHDTSFIGLILGADPIVMAIMALLLVMSILSWTIIFSKLMAFRVLNFKTQKFEQEFWSADALDQFHEKIKKKKVHHPIAHVFDAAMEEWARSRKKSDQPSKPNTLRIGLPERMLQMMSVTRNRELDKLESGIGFLGTAGSSAPFIGLLGTVIGIMNSFRAIAGAQNTSLAVVAPGIAEALMVTALGLFVAIPAVIAYNKLSQELARFAGRLDDFATEFATLLNRQLENAK